MLAEEEDGQLLSDLIRFLEKAYLSITHYYLFCPKI